MSVRHLKPELLDPLLESLDVDDGHLVAIEYNEPNLVLGGVRVEAIFALAGGGFTVSVERRSLVQKLLEDLDR